MLQQFRLTTTMGSLYKWDSDLQNILTEDEVKELNTIGYTGKNSKGERTNFEDYLNSLGKGEFVVRKTVFDNGSFIEKYEIARTLTDTTESLSKDKRYELYLELKKEFGE